jgi:hypothetical protein
VSPESLFDPSFQMSFAAVVGLTRSFALAIYHFIACRVRRGANLSLPLVSLLICRLH